MKIFATSDLHGNRTIMDKLKAIAPKVDLILICGDIGGKDGRGKTFRQFSEYQKRDADYLVSVLRDIQTESRFILGNDDWFEYEDGHYLQGTETVGNLTLIPFEYVLLTPFNTNREVNDNKLSYELAKLDADGNTIMVAHTPPLGAGDILYNGSRCGSRAVREWIEEVQPKLWLCGHIHEDNSAEFIGNTLVLNCSCEYQNDILQGWIVDLDTMQYEKIEL
ncbi:MAG: metallophosphoesterase family protein [Oscillospiraceae bacterium]|nr:metallophosphoesterase family protein [Oscillospiraceae bacterium]